MASADTLIAIAPEFAGDTAIGQMLTWAAQRIDAEAWGDLYEQGCIYLACHMLETKRRGSEGSAGAGPVVGEQAGELKRSYGAVVGVLDSDAVYATTPYGVQYLTLRRQVAAWPMVV